MNKYKLLLALGLGLASISAQAAVVECLISGTPTPQRYTEESCASQTSSQKSAVNFRLKSSKPVARVTWSYRGYKGRWDCGTGTSCRFSNYSSYPDGTVTACAKTVLYTDGTWENLNSCATGMYWYQGSPFFPEATE
ncbi:hypothetical protein L1077_23860 [Pseudoalteromonas luteoviolacea]|uniref:hypothetical protein n=1 Tax=Pseudoalteromonas luteoviolacea TaxID=43657 RepID=UPI001F3071D5|nr:hypothetical protein [Pseudoalteromonas luteoviolacea]MCF6442469.1 hypothetical protein [Pseudoalteromonas luteoviolacea]